MDIDLKSKGSLAEFSEGHYVLRYFVKELHLGLNLATQSASYFSNGQLPRKNKYNYNIILLFKSSRLFIDWKYQQVSTFFLLHSNKIKLTHQTSQKISQARMLDYPDLAEIYGPGY